MIKIDYCRDAKGLEHNLTYISGTGRYKKKGIKERVVCDPRIKSRKQQEAFLADYAETLRPKNKNQRRGKRVAIKLIISWLDVHLESQNEFLDDFMFENFPNTIWTWALHQKPNKNGAATSHFHLVICPRRKDGTMIDIKKADVKRLQDSYLELSKKYNLRAGWDREQIKPEKTPRKRRTRKRTLPTGQSKGYKAR